MTADGTAQRWLKGVWYSRIPAAAAREKLAERAGQRFVAVDERQRGAQDCVDRDVLED